MILSTLRGRLGKVANVLLKPLGVRLVPAHPPWDRLFKEWIEQARRNGTDPNDIGDREWSDDHLEDTLENCYLPHVSTNSVVLELGPGTGRLTRHLIKRCREIICVDYSSFVCEWLAEYLKEKGHFTVHHITKPSLPMIPDASVDLVVANGVFEHIEIEELTCFLDEFYRIVKPSGIVSFNFNNLMTTEGMQWFKKWRGEPGTKCIFRFYHPDAVRRLAESSGFTTLCLRVNDSRLSHIEIEKPLPKI